MDPDAKALDYHDVLLRQGDVQLLAGAHWLNDQVIAFYFEYLLREAFAGAGVLLVSGDSTYLLANLGPDAGPAVVLEPRGFAAARLVLFAVNNNPDVECAGGGSHWSLLAYSAGGNSFHSYDSMAGSNRQAARAVYKAAAAAAPPGARFVEERAPQQANGYDCGVHVLALAKLLCERAAAAAAAGSQAVDMQVSSTGITPASVTALRQEVLELVRGKIAAAAAGAAGSS
ncbi:NEDD8-specific protease 1 [Chlorella sorokiniana]|uniref:NEDD8-specific protease 1 n=1 Tax=Chlorella sorokiniana TaxID=3076 RepID=A0A2P6U068_CHLSO|nr:NEDD8-specific protease 1 [Chlorella sorokiniana]|eukprot:PRW59712.1 NEDD8-specific protease 1 [Chlorella sorokiniana]